VFDVEISLFIVTCGLLLETILIVVMSLLSFYVFTRACHCKVYLFGGRSEHTEQMMVDVLTTKWRYRRYQRIRIWKGVYYIKDTVTQESIKFRKEKKGNKNMDISVENNQEHNTNTYGHGDHAALATQLERQVEKRT